MLKIWDYWFILRRLGLYKTGVLRPCLEWSRYIITFNFWKRSELFRPPGRWRQFSLFRCSPADVTLHYYQPITTLLLVRWKMFTWAPTLAKTRIAISSVKFPIIIMLFQILLNHSPKRALSQEILAWMSIWTQKY